MKYSRIVAEFSNSLWAIRPEKLVAIQAFLAFKSAGGEVSAEEIALIQRSSVEPVYFYTGAVGHDSSEGKDDASAWDGSAAVARLRKWASTDGSGDKEKMDWAKYRRGFAWYDAANEDSFDSYKLPHHDIKGGKFVVVLRGVEAAMGSLLGSRGGVEIPASDRKAVYNHLAAEYREFGKEPPAYHSESLNENIRLAVLGEDGQYHDLSAAAPSNSSRSRAGAIAVLPLMGTISHRMGMLSEASGGTSAERFTGWLRAAVKDPNVKAIVMDVDSPGGTVDGVPELAEEIYQAREAKPITAVANCQAASAAYWLAAQAGELCMSPSAEVGSIGVFSAHQDISKAAEMEGVKVSLVSAGKYKTEANPFEPLSDEARQALQSKVNGYYDQFVKAVARGRGVPMAQVKGGFGEGRMVSAKQAVAEGMADRVSTIDQVLSRLGATSGKMMPPQAAVISEGEEQQAGVCAPSEPPKNSPVYRRVLRERELQLFQ